MQLRKEQFHPLIASLVAVGAGYVISNPLVFGLCSRIYKFNDSLGCLDKTIELVGRPLFIYSLLVLPLSLAIVFVRRETFKSWTRLAVWWIPLSAILVFLTPDTSHQVISLTQVVNYDNTAKFMGALFAIISLILIGWKTFFSRSKVKP